MGDPLAWFTVQGQTWRDRLDPTSQVNRIALVLESPLSPGGRLNTWLPVLGGLVMVAAWGGPAALAASGPDHHLSRGGVDHRHGLGQDRRPPPLVLAAPRLVMAQAWATRGSPSAA